MPRPKKQPGERRTRRINPRFTPAEHAQVEQAALRAGMSAAEYARAQTLKGRVTLQSHRTLDPAAFDELRRIGVNLNQLARIANQSGRVPDRLGKALTQLETILTRELGGGPATAAQARAAHDTAQPARPAPRPESQPVPAAPARRAAQDKKAPVPASLEPIPNLIKQLQQDEPGPVPNLIKPAKKTPASPPPEPEKKTGVAQRTRAFLQRLTGGETADASEKAAAEPDKKPKPPRKRAGTFHDP